MAATMAGTCSSSALFNPLAVKSSSFVGTPVEAARVAPVRRTSRLTVSCESKGPLSAIKQIVDSTKVPLSKDQIEKNSQENYNNDAVTGFNPIQGEKMPLPRPEVARRPETGSRDIFDIMLFDGPGPETMNGRLAMLGCAWGFISELYTGQRIIDQINYPGSPGLFWLLASIQILVIATLIPFFNGESTDSRKNGPFTAKAERWNGRLAMIGFLGIILNEAIRMQPVFPHLL